MKAILLAAGEGTRLRPLTETIPKCLVPIHEKPLLWYWLELLTKHSVKDVIINTSYLSEQVASFLDAYNSDKLNIEISHEENLLGTAGTIENNQHFIGCDPFFCIHADNLTDANLTEMMHVHQHRPSNCIMTMLSFVTDDPQSCGILELDDQGVVTGFHEKVVSPPGNTANGAVYIFESGIIDRIINLPSGLKDISMQILPDLIGKIQTYKHDGYHRDIGNLKSLERARRSYSNG